MTLAKLDRFNVFAWWRGYMLLPTNRNRRRFAIIRKPDLKAMQRDRVDPYAAVTGAQRLFRRSLRAQTLDRERGRRGRAMTDPIWAYEEVARELDKLAERTRGTIASTDLVDLLFQAVLHELELYLDVSDAAEAVAWKAAEIQLRLDITVQGTARQQ
jgi:hypothetical protein